MQGSSYFQARSGNRKRGASALDERELREKLGSCTDHRALRDLPLKQHSRIHSLHDNIKSHFANWRLQLKLGYSLLFYGYGSKRAVLDKFALEACTDGGVLCVNGQSPSLTARALVLKISSMLKPTQGNKASGDTDSLIRSLQQSRYQASLYIVIHGLDGPGLRNVESQASIASIAAIDGVHLVASIDHVNAPMLWEKSTTAAFNWLYQELTTFMPYHTETLGVQPLLSSIRTETQRAGALVVLQTLVPNARAIFKILAENQIGLAEETEGMTVHQLFDACRSRFLVANELALRSHLNEFRDHSLVQMRRTADGAEEVHVPIEAGTLEELLAEL